MSVVSVSALACEGPGCHRRAETTVMDETGRERHVCRECVGLFGGGADGT